MGKFGNDFQTNQIEEWKEKYMNYISLKQKINKYQIEFTNKNIKEISQIEKKEIMDKYEKEFTEELNKEIRKVYVLYSREEKHLYKSINKYLHIKEDFANYTMDDYLTQYIELKDLSITSFKLAKFVYYNLKCLINILTKFDNKIIGPKDKENHIKNNYIIEKLEDQNSDILYLINFKMLDEVNVILEDLIKCLKDSFKLQKNNFKNSVINLSNKSSANAEQLLEKQTLNLNDTSLIIDCFHKEIKDNIKNIDTMSNNVIMLFMPWKKFLRISGDISSKLIQLSKELNNFSDSMGSNDGLSSPFNNNKSIVDTISFSKQNMFNIYITLFHGYVYMFSFSSTLPFYPGLITSEFWGKSEERKDNPFLLGLLMMMAPLGAIISYIYESAWFKINTKIPLIVSLVGLLLGNLFFYISVNIDPFIFLFLGRFFLGLFNLRTHNKMYIMNFLLRKDISYYLTLFHTFSMLGLSCGFLINNINQIFSDEKHFINKYTFGSLLSFILCLILLLITIKLFTEARSSNFNMTTMRSFSSVESGNLVRESTLNTLSNRESINLNTGDFNENKLINEDILNEEFTEDVRKKSIMVNDINDQLGDYNRKSNFNDTNLVSLSVSQLTYQEKEGLKYLFKSFLVYLFIVFTTKFINEAIFISLPIFNKEKTDWIVPTVLGCSCLIVLLIEFCLKNKNKFISEKTLLIILFILNLVNNFILVFLKKNIFFFIVVGLSIIFSNILEKYSTHFFNYIIPQNYIVCKIQGNIFINVVSMLSRIIASILIMTLNDTNKLKILIFTLNIIFSFICAMLFFVFYSDLRIKSISRILTKQDKDEIKIATEI